jgi:UDP-glucose 4-epimerase
LGYIGRHVSLLFLQHGFDILIVDNLSNSSMAVLECMRVQYASQLIFEYADMEDKVQLAGIFAKYGQRLTTVVYALRNSFQANSTHHMRNYNVVGMLSGLVQAMEAGSECGVSKLILVSNVDIYVGAPSQNNKYGKKDGFNLQNPYSFLVYLKEKIVHEYYGTKQDLSLVILRVSVPVGSHKLFWSAHSTTRMSLQHSVIKHYRDNQTALLCLHKSPTETMDGSVLINFVCVQDVGNAVMKAYYFLRSQERRIFKIYNVANDTCQTAIQWLRTLVVANYVPTPRFLLVFNNSSSVLKHHQKKYNIEDTKEDLRWVPEYNVTTELGTLLTELIKK